MDEPQRITFNRQVGQSVYIFWLVEPADMGAVMGAVSINFMIFESYWLFLWTILGYFAYVIALRAGRPSGYDRHFFGSLSAPSYLRPGRSDSKAYVREPKT
jgi:hypothetical protein